MQGTDKGKAIVIKEGAGGVLGTIKDDVLDAYEQKIKAVGGIDLHIVGVGGRGHVAFHESGIPFEGNRVLLVKLDDNTVENAVRDGHFPSIEESPRYAISMGAELVYEAPTVVLLANGSRKTGPVAESVLGEVTCDVPISYGQKYAADGRRSRSTCSTKRRRPSCSRGGPRRRPRAARSSTCATSRRQRGGPWKRGSSVCSRSAVPQTGAELREALGDDGFGQWKACMRSDRLAVRRVGRRYLRLDQKVEGYARLSPSILREFLTYSVVGLADDPAALEREDRGAGCSYQRTSARPS